MKPFYPRSRTPLLAFAAFATAACGPAGIARLNVDEPCTELAARNHCEGATPRDVRICVVFDNQGCIAQKPARVRTAKDEYCKEAGKGYADVRPCEAHVCPQDTLEWVAVREKKGGGFITSDDAFQVLFVPLSRFLGVAVEGEQPDRAHKRGVYDSAVHEAVYKYTLVPARDNCPMYDPRIKVDPK